MRGTLGRHLTSRTRDRPGLAGRQLVSRVSLPAPVRAKEGAREAPFSSSHRSSGVRHPRRPSRARRRLGQAEPEVFEIVDVTLTDAKIVLSDKIGREGEGVDFRSANAGKKKTTASPCSPQRPVIISLDRQGCQHAAAQAGQDVGDLGLHGCPRLVRLSQPRRGGSGRSPVCTANCRSSESSERGGRPVSAAAAARARRLRRRRLRQGGVAVAERRPLRNAPRAGRLDRLRQRRRSSTSAGASASPRSRASRASSPRPRSPTATRSTSRTSAATSSRSTARHGRAPLDAALRRAQRRAERARRRGRPRLRRDRLRCVRARRLDGRGALAAAPHEPQRAIRRHRAASVERPRLPEHDRLCRRSGAARSTRSTRRRARPLEVRHDRGPLAASRSRPAAAASGIPSRSTREGASTPATRTRRPGAAPAAPERRAPSRACPLHGFAARARRPHGRLLWYDQVTPHDVRDYDFQATPILATVGGTDLVFGAGKAGRVIAWDRAHATRAVDRQRRPAPQRRRAAAAPPRDRVPRPPRRRRDADGVRGRPALRAGRRPLRRGSATARSTLDERRPGRGRRPARRARCGDRAARCGSAVCPSPDFGCATVANDVVFTSTYDGTVYALDATTASALARPAARGHQRVPGARRRPAARRRGRPARRGAAPELVAFSP